MVSNVSFKTNAKGEPWAILNLEDLTDKVEALLMASHFDPATRKRTRTFELYRHLALTDALLRVKGELKVETAGGQRQRRRGGRGGADRHQAVRHRPGEPGGPAGQGLQRRRGEPARGRYPSGCCPLLRLYHGPLPLQIEFQGQDGTVARVKAGPELNLRFDPDLSERLAKEAGCGLSWTY